MKDLVILLVVLTSSAVPARAQNAATGKPQAAELPEYIDKSDRSGANPLNFQSEIRFYNKFTWLNVHGGGKANATTLEYRQPFAGGKWQFRTRIPVTGIEQNTADKEIDEWGLGEIDFRVLTVPYFDKTGGHALAVGIETFLPTATTHGPERLTFGPQAVYVKLRPFGLKDFLFAAGYQHKVSTWEEPRFDFVHQGLIDFRAAWISSGKQYWVLLDPQIVVDYEENQIFAIADLELGMMLDRLTDSDGHSAYLRPSIGIGRDRPSDHAIEIGYKVVW